MHCWPIRHQYSRSKLACAIIHLLLGVVILFPSSGNAAESGPCGKNDCSIAVTQTDPNTERVDITKPVVTQPFFDYKSIVFMSGDKIGIDAGGCVQKGGIFGLTWKRYVNPSGDNSSRLYFGSIEIPGALSKTRFSDILGQTITPPVIDPTTLVLHYEDKTTTPITDITITTMGPRTSAPVLTAALPMSH